MIGCATDVVEESVNTIPGTTVLSVNIADSYSRVHLGDKGEDGQYSVAWSAGDRISVNGYTSEEVVINPNNAGAAQFEVRNAILDYPYNVLYPASANGLVSFPAQQNYLAGSFEAGTTPMYGRTTGGGKNIQLNHLSGVMRFNFKGEVTLVSMTVTAEKGYIAGDFSLDFENGAIAPTESATSTIEYSFGRSEERRVGKEC